MAQAVAVALASHHMCKLAVKKVERPGSKRVRCLEESRKRTSTDVINGCSDGAGFNTASSTLQIWNTTTIIFFVPLLTHSWTLDVVAGTYCTAFYV